MIGGDGLKTRTTKTCSVCGGIYYAKDLCKFHYDRKRKGCNITMNPIARRNEYQIIGDCAEVTFYDKNHEEAGVFLVDADMINQIQNIKWSVISSGYIAGYQNGKMLLLHRFITNCPVEMVVDHINRNRLDNRLSNLRVCTQKENMDNCQHPVGKTGVKGITKTKRGYFIAQKNGKYLGCSKDIETAKSYL